MTSERLLASSEDEYTRLEMSLAIPNASITLSSEANSSETSCQYWLSKEKASKPFQSDSIAR